MAATRPAYGSAHGAVRAAGLRLALAPASSCGRREPVCSSAPPSMSASR